MFSEILAQIISNIFYMALHVTGAGSFPPPLSAKREAELLELKTRGDIDAKNQLIEHNLRLVAHIVKKYYAAGCDQEDLISIGTIGLIKAINTFKPDKKTRLATYAARCIENEILMYLRKTQKSRNDCSLDEVLSIDSDGNEMVLADILASTDESSLSKLEHDEDIDNLYYAIGKLSKREREIVIKRFGLFGEEELTQKEVADMMGISQSYISRLEKRILEKMRRIIEERVRVA